MTLEHTEKKKRSLTLSTKMNEDLESLCEHLGINCHAYMMAEIAKCIQRDILTLTSQNSLQTMMEKLQKVSDKA